jgi:hypothetical protein
MQAANKRADSCHAGKGLAREAWRFMEREGDKILNHQGEC